MVARCLVTTADEATWPALDVPVLFLGEWCRLYDRKPAWEKRDAVVAPYHWDNRRKLHQDYLFLKTLYEELLEELASQLNALHRVDHSVRYWRIVVGPWLGSFIQIAFDRWAMLQQVLSDCEISCVRLLRRGNAELVPNDYAQFTTMYCSDAWNELIYGQILNQMGIQIEIIDVAAGNLPISRGYKTGSIARRLKRDLARGLSHLSCLLSRENEYFFISSYLPVKQDLLLQARLGQLPKLWRSDAVPASSFNQAMRQWQLSEQKDKNEFSSVVRTLIPGQIPKSYVEGYRSLISLSESIRWPQRPKAIFTSNSFDNDDVFKVWAGNKVQSGVPLVIGQHGGHYGIGLWNSNEDHQIAIADRYLTWGWKAPEQLKTVPAVNFKGIDASIIANKRGIALLVGMSMPRQSYWMYSAPVAAGQWQSYFDEQVRFVNALPVSLRDQFIIRLDASDYGHSQWQRWQARWPSIHLDDGIRPMKALLRKSRVIISTYNATTYLESMSLNFPTIIFWNPTHWEIRASALPYFDELKSVGIFHETPESAAQHLVAIWNNVSSWWESTEVQTVRKLFCKQFAYIPEKQLDEMEKIFRDIGIGNCTFGDSLPRNASEL